MCTNDIVFFSQYTEYVMTLNMMKSLSLEQIPSNFILQKSYGMTHDTIF